MQGTDRTLRVALWIAVIDVATGVTSSVSWVHDYGLATVGPVAVALGLWMVLWFVALQQMLAPVRLWSARTQAGEVVDDALLLAADAALRRTPVRFTVLHALGWSVAMVVATLASGLAVGSAQLVAGLFNLVSVVVVMPAILLPVFRGVLLDTHRELAEALLGRGLRPPRTRVPLIKGLVAVLLTLMIAAMIGMVGLSIWYRAEGRAALASAEQQRLAELDALRLGLAARGEAARVMGAVVADRDALPPALAGRSEDGASVTAVDRGAGRVYAAAPVGDGRWVLYQAPLEDDSLGFGVGLLIGVLLSTLPGILAGMSLNRALTSPLAAIEGAARSIATQGRLRQQARVATFFDDEIGDVARAFNAMLDTFEQLAEVAAAVTEGDLRVEPHGPGDLQDAFRAMVAKLDEVVVQIRSTTLEVASAAAEIQAATQEQERAVEQQSASVHEVGETVSSLAMSAESVTEAARGVLANAEQTRETTDQTSERIAELSALASGIGELLDLIRDVADRSDLLALNGSLEAVRAGEAGRGFALVAAEMRRLAERVTGTVAVVAERIGTIQQASAATVFATESSRALAESTAAAARRISTETQQQSRDTDQLAIAVHEVAEVAVATSRATSHTRSTAAGLRNHAEQLERLTRQFKLRGDPDA